MGFPKRKRKGRGTESCRLTTGAIRVEADRHHVTLPRIGRIRTHESTRKLVNRAISQPRRSQATVGVDVGIRYLVVLCDGRLVPNPAPLRQAQRRPRQLHRQLARRRGPRAADGSWRTPSAGWLQIRPVLVGLTANGVAGSGPETGNACGWGRGLPFGGVVLDEAGSRRQVMGLG
jgi:putative transposase